MVTVDIHIREARAPNEGEHSPKLSGDWQRFYAFNAAYEPIFSFRHA